jgi:hypothetical protein
MLYTLLQGLDWQHITTAAHDEKTLPEPETNSDGPNKRRQVLTTVPSLALDTTIPPLQLWGALDERVKNELNSIEFKVSSSVYTFSLHWRPKLGPKFLMKSMLLPSLQLELT